jgi:hypothetical protein
MTRRSIRPWRRRSEPARLFGRVDNVHSIAVQSLHNCALSFIGEIDSGPVNARISPQELHTGSMIVMIDEQATVAAVEGSASLQRLTRSGQRRRAPNRWEGRKWSFCLSELF